MSSVHPAQDIVSQESGRLLIEYNLTVIHHNGSCGMHQRKIRIVCGVNAAVAATDQVLYLLKHQKLV